MNKNEHFSKVSTFFSKVENCYNDMLLMLRWKPGLIYFFIRLFDHINNRDGLDVDKLDLLWNNSDRI